MAPGRGGWVYFLRPVGLAGPVKIGCSAVPEERLKTYMQWAPFPLEVAARVKGGEELERRFHTLLLEHHTHHEWFRASPEVAAVVEAVRNGTFDFATLPPQAGRLPAKRKVIVYTPARRQYLSLLHRQGRLYKRTGIRPPQCVRDALDFLSRNEDAGRPREVAVAVVEEFLRCPLKSGDVPPYDWTQKAFEAWAPSAGFAPIRRAA